MKLTDFIWKMSSAGIPTTLGSEANAIATVSDSLTITFDTRPTNRIDARLNNKIYQINSWTLEKIIDAHTQGAAYEVYFKILNG